MPPEGSKILGEHLKSRRLRLGLTKGEVAEKLGVDPTTIRSWEEDEFPPAIRYQPGILAFLGYDPYPTPKSLPEQLLAARRRLGLTRKGMAHRLGIKPDRLAGWEQGWSKPNTSQQQERVDSFLRKILQPLEVFSGHAGMAT